MSKWFAIIFFISFGLVSVQAADTIYQWVDENGITHFSDRPQVGATELQVDVAPPATDGPLATPRTPLKKKQKPVKYQVQITSPSHEQTIRDNEGKISITATTTPLPLNSMGYKLVLDGVPQGQITKMGSFNLTNIDRGAHTIHVQLVDDSGKEIASSKPITVFLHRANAFGAGAAAAGGG
ncbi:MULTISPECIES: DUF4124 domain-containing protein [unclassified Agarivorans]|uniref:DUF4124 domain-containing protein n=1 Tax=unclassified Agarivorans TaxID=2636026 RepID=UPI0026E12837|nr:MULTISPECIES: DUF4124 domain-containing protein [unclassified Agarivorans]MDO6685458.1 DUF4124 domain-containing protein [Agarivorans sp. 3_MG-2023]MDO6715844.1 DUF4124 domain-containing protein [Agarivorans sp. 2_MG-2023]MDO6764886.1 DUF4124 domain-containing protein [Agarivorans sp. 1_MG-2023]